MKEITLETKSCAQCQIMFDITDRDMEFYDKMSPTFDGVKFDIPAPSLCPDCRQRRRLAFRNERNLYRRTCDATKQPIISIYNPECEFKVYDQKLWRSDMRDPMDYGRDFNFSKTFTEQFTELMRDVPRLSLINMNSENSDYCNPGYFNKNCYLIYSITHSEDCAYGRRVDDCKDCFDNMNLKDSQQCYYCICSERLFECFACINCRDCSHCINCYDLENKQFCIENIQYTKEEYQDYIQRNNIQVDQNILAKHNHELDSRNNINCNGGHIANSKNCIYCYDINEGTDLRHCDFFKPGVEDCIDVSLAKGSQLLRECLSGLSQYYCLGAVFCRNSKYIYYSDHCQDCSNLFGCIGLRNKEYCIFNKQYSKDEYEKIVRKIIEHMQVTGERGEFFHPSLSPFAYNESVAKDYFPLEYKDGKIQTITNDKEIDYSQFGYRRSNYIIPASQVDRVIKGQDLPDAIDGFNANGESLELGINILKVAVICEISGKPFRIIPQELAFYLKYRIPIPRRHPDQRYMNMLTLRA